MSGASESSVPERVAAVCQEGITDAKVDGAGVTMLAGTGTRLPVWSSDGVSAEVEDLQVTLGQGPCVDAIASGLPVLVDDLAGPLCTAVPPVALTTSSSTPPGHRTSVG